LVPGVFGRWPLGARRPVGVGRRGQARPPEVVKVRPEEAARIGADEAAEVGLGHGRHVAAVEVPGKEVCM
jgi:hypothetical protein